LTRIISGKSGVGAAVIASVIASTFAVNGCAVWASADCLEKASCVRSASTGGQDVDAQGTDHDGPDAAADTGGAPADAAGDAGTDAANDSMEADATPDAGARCVATGPESCTNGIDDDCNGKVDCADPACGAYTCAPAVPSGWDGPVALAEVPGGSALPACPTAFEALVDASLGLSAPSAATCDCTCGASGKATGQVCSATGTFHTDQACSSAPCATVAVSSAATSCVAVGSTRCGSGGSFNMPAAPAPSGGSCAPHVTTTTAPATWATSARLCSYVGGPRDVSGCSGASACVAAPASPYRAGLCVYSTADPPPAACPAGYEESAPIVLYAGTADTRACGACTCGGPIGGSCAGTVSLFGAAGCTGATGAASYTLGSSCRAYSGLSPAPGSVEASVTVSAGSCSVQAMPQPTGGVTPAMPTTVCCM
jgi:hypothetical protein